MPNFTPEGKRNQLVGLVIGLVLFVILSNIAFSLIFADRIYPGIIIEGIRVGGLTKKEAWALLQQKLPELPNQEIILEAGSARVSSSSAQLVVERNIDTVVESAYTIGRSPNIIDRIRQRGDIFLSVFNPTIFAVGLRYDNSAAEQLIEQLNTKIEVVGVLPSAKLITSRSPGSITINPGTIGQAINTEVAQERIWESLQQNIEEETPQSTVRIITIPIASTGAHLTDQQVAAATQRATHLVGKRLILRAQDTRVEVDDRQLISLLQFPDSLDQEKLTTTMNEWVANIDRNPENAEFSYDKNTLKVNTFKPSHDGLALNYDAAQEQIKADINKLVSEEPIKSGVLNEYHDTEIQLPVETVKPDITLDSTNDLGIKEQIGIGESEYDHSIPNRIHNVAITTERINNSIIAPGAEFSFNKNVGEVSALTGYKSAYVIKDGKTELGDGGGVCQVSTTLFRAVLNAGLEVTRRLPHSYRVSYYELNAKPGIDATVYAGDTDFRFKNDTNHYILIHAEADSTNLYMKVQIYGTSDGRTSEIKDHEVWDFVTPPPTEYYPDPSLKPGQRKQIDWSVGGVKAKFTSVVKDKDGKVIRENTYYSNYKPWSAKYLVGV